MKYGLEAPRVPVPLIVVRRIYYEKFLAGTKTAEFRRYKPPWTERVFYPGRLVSITYRYDNSAPRLPATVRLFESKPLHEVPDMIGFYPDMRPQDHVAIIHLTIDSAAARRLTHEPP